MIRIDFSPRFLRSLRKIKPDLTAEAEQCLGQVAEGFGNPHAHSGLGLRKIAVDSYEARIGLHYRIIFIRRKDFLEAYDVMNHDEVSLWLRGKRK